MVRLDRGLPPADAPLDAFIASPDARERFGVIVDAPAGIVFAAAQEFDLQSPPLIRAIFRLREILTGSAPVHREPKGMLAELTSIGWGILRTVPDRLLVCGARCQPWLADVRFRPIPAAEFTRYVEPGEVKIAWTIEVDPLAGTRSRLVSETRAQATDPQARRRSLRYWCWARFGILPIRWLLLPAIGRRAEAEWRRQARARRKGEILTRRVLRTAQTPAHHPGSTEKMN